MSSAINEAGPDVLDGPQLVFEIRRRHLALLAASWVAAAAVGSLAGPRPRKRRSGFTIGVSAIGGPDGIGGKPSWLQSLTALV